MKRILFALLLALLPMQIQAEEWKARWITAEHENGGPCTWMVFRKIVSLDKVPDSLEARISADSKYWLWINGQMVVREGCLKRGPAPGDGYFDRVQIAPALKAGENVIAVLVYHFGKSGFSHMSSGNVAFLFDAQAPGIEILTDDTWEVAHHSSYMPVPDETPNYRLPESNVRFDARAFDQSWITTTSKVGHNAVMLPNKPGTGPLGALVERPIPQWKDYGLKQYEKVERKGNKIVCTLPYNAHFSPYIELDATAGKLVKLRTDHTDVAGSGCIVGEYVTRKGAQEYEHLPWMNGQYMYYIVDEGVNVKSVAYRETGYDTEFTGSWHCDSPILNDYWAKAVRTLYVCMRDTYMDCPDRERAQWWGDEVHELTEAFYALSPSSRLLARKGILELCNWAATDGVLYSPIPCSNYFKELPQQILASVGWYGFRTYTFYSGEESLIADFYPSVHRYLHDVWQLDADSLPIERQGGWNWADAGTNIDRKGLLVPWYYLALKAEREYAQKLGFLSDAAEDAALMSRIEDSFSRLYWNGREFRSPGFEGPADDRVQAMAVISGLCSPERYGAVAEVFENSRFAQTYFLRYVLEACFRIGRADMAIDRMYEFYPTVMKSGYSTLSEHWNHHGTSNHAWTGSGIITMVEELAGIKPLEPGFKRFSLNPQMGSLNEIDTSFETPFGRISVSLRRRSRFIGASITVPNGATAVARDARNKEIIIPSGTHTVKLHI